jgi:hypothetical protein
VRSFVAVALAASLSASSLFAQTGPLATAANRELLRVAATQAPDPWSQVRALASETSISVTTKNAEAKYYTFIAADDLALTVSRPSRKFLRTEVTRVARVRRHTGTSPKTSSTKRPETAPRTSSYSPTRGTAWR